MKSTDLVEMGPPECPLLRIFALARGYWDWDKGGVVLYTGGNNLVSDKWDIKF
jgi:hypothetical protein